MKWTVTMEGTLSHSSGCTSGRSATSATPKTDRPSLVVSPSVTWDPGSRGIPLSYARDLRPLAAGSARRKLHLAPQAASRNPPHRPGSLFIGVAAAGGGRSESGIQGPIPSDPGIRGPLHPLRLRCPPSPYRSGYASVGRLAGSGASTLSMHGLFRNEPLDAGAQAFRFTARRATNEVPLRRSPPEQRYTAADGGGCGADDRGHATCL